VKAAPKRPLLPAAERARLRRMLTNAARNGATGFNRAYCSGVVDVLLWLDGEDLTPMLTEVTS
jgi:hypothetical protein